jgi:hypothetical protein
MYLKWLAGEETPVHLQVDFSRLYLFGCEVRVFMDRRATVTEKKHIIEHIIAEWNKAKTNLSKQKSYSQLMLDYAYFVDSAVIDNNAYELIENLSSEMACNLALSRHALCYMRLNKEGVTNDTVFQLICDTFDLNSFVPKQYIPYAEKILKRIISKYISKINTTENSKPTYLIRSYSPLDAKPYPLFRSFHAHYPDYTYHIKLPEIVETVYMQLDGMTQQLRSEFAAYNRIIKESRGLHTIQAILALPSEIDISHDVALNPLQKICKNGKANKIDIADLKYFIYGFLQSRISAIVLHTSATYSPTISLEMARRLQEIGYIICPGLSIEESEKIYYSDAIVYKVDSNNAEYQESFICKSLYSSSPEVLTQLERFGTLAALSAILTGKGFNEVKQKALKDLLLLYGAKAFDAEYFSYYYQCRCNTYRSGFYVPIQRRTEKYLKTYVPFNNVEDFLTMLSENDTKKRMLLMKILKLK